MKLTSFTVWKCNPPKEFYLTMMVKTYITRSGDDTVTNGEFEDGWMALSSQTQAVVNAYFHLADVNDDMVIDQKGFPIVYMRFDLNCM